MIRRHTKFDEVIVTHTCREVAELQYNETADAFLNDPDIGEIAQGKLRVYHTCTREEHDKMGRITDLIAPANCLMIWACRVSMPRRPRHDLRLHRHDQGIERLMEEHGLRERQF